MSNYNDKKKFEACEEIIRLSKEILKQNKNHDIKFCKKENGKKVFIAK